MTAVPLPPIVPTADLVAELRAMHSIPCLTAADRLEEIERQLDNNADELMHYEKIVAARRLPLGLLLALWVAGVGAAINLAAALTWGRWYLWAAMVACLAGAVANAREIIRAVR